VVQNLKTWMGQLRRIQHPIDERATLGREAAVVQRRHRERRVAQPAVAIVPIADATDFLRQRRRWCGDNRARRRVRQQLEHECAPQYLLAILALVREPRAPLEPEIDRALDLFGRFFADVRDYRGRAVVESEREVM